MAVYDEAFYDTLNSAGASSANVVLPLVVKTVNPKSAVDVGCGTGIWTHALAQSGVQDTLGIDGDYVPRDQLRVNGDRFQAVDLGRPFALGRVFDLAVCVEVAEHLDADRADGFVADLVDLAPAILFSAASPGQGGTHHVNEQWPEYWISRFEAHGFTCWDVIRPAIRYDRRVAWIYRQNLILVLGPGHDAVERLNVDQRLRCPEAGDVAFDYVARYILERQLGLRDTARRLPSLVRRAISNRFAR